MNSFVIFEDQLINVDNISHFKLDYNRRGEIALSVVTTSKETFSMDLCSDSLKSVLLKEHLLVASDEKYKSLSEKYLSTLAKDILRSKVININKIGVVYSIVKMLESDYSVMLYYDTRIQDKEIYRFLPGHIVLRRRADNHIFIIWNGSDNNRDDGTIFYGKNVGMYRKSGYEEFRETVFENIQSNVGDVGIYSGDDGANIDKYDSITSMVKGLRGYMTDGKHTVTFLDYYSDCRKYPEMTEEDLKALPYQAKLEDLLRDKSLIVEDIVEKLKTRN